jgi:Protein of unknown function (DUF3592)
LLCLFCDVGAVAHIGPGEYAARMSIVHAGLLVGAGPVADASDHAAQDAVAWILIGVSLLGAFLAIFGLRNMRLWVRGLTGVRAFATVSKIEISTGPRGSSRRPHVRFTTSDGDTIDTATVLYRDRCRLKAGDQVPISYSRRRPANITIRGYDFRMREPFTSAIGLLIAIGGTVVIFHL